MLTADRKDCKDENKSRHLRSVIGGECSESLCFEIFFWQFVSGVALAAGALNHQGSSISQMHAEKIGFQMRPKTQLPFFFFFNTEKNLKEKNAGLTQRKGPTSWLLLPVIATFLDSELCLIVIVKVFIM